MVIRRFVNSIFKSNSYVVYEDRTCFIVDIGDFEPIDEFIKSNKLDVQGLLITHTHYDHIYGIRDFICAYPNVAIYTSAFGKIALNKSNWNLSRYHNDPIEIDSPSILTLWNGSVIQMLGYKCVKALNTPGHDKSCLTFEFDNILFTGDSYIPDVKVIASFPNSDKMEAAIWYERLKERSVDHIICPGHNEIEKPEHLANLEILS